MRPQIRRTLRALTPRISVRDRGPSRRAIFSCCCLVFLLLVGRSQNIFAFALNGYSWPPNTQIVMHLQLTRAPVALQDGSPSWTASAADALGIWNQYLESVKFMEAGPLGPSRGDGANSAFFSTNIYGDSFPSNVLAVTLNYSDSGSRVFTETDVIFNNNIQWNSYRGPIHGTGAAANYDFHRVALHEFGHVLGLDHPNEHGQNVTALMNAVIGDLDHLADDDIAGAAFLYGIRITSPLDSLTIQAGDFFSYQITANNTPVTYEASGLPPGLSLDPNSGSISGIPTVAGSFMVAIVAHGTSRDVSGTLPITVLGSSILGNLSPPSVRVGELFSYQIMATKSPSGFDAAGLPAGLLLNRTSGLISGIASVAGVFTVTITAHTAAGDASAILTITIIPPDLTSSHSSLASLGGNFNYQITAANNPSSYDAVGLPAGLELDRATGLITGTLALSGSYQFTLIAHGPQGDAVGTVQITVTAPSPLQPKPHGVIKSFDIAAERFAFDPSRSRLYASDQSSGTIVVIDTVSLMPVAAIKVPHQPYGLTISADNKKLWIACSDTFNSYDGWISGIDLGTLEVLPSVHLSAPILYVADGPNQRLYASGSTNIFELDQDSGALLSTVSPGHGFWPQTGTKVSCLRRVPRVHQQFGPSILLTSRLSFESRPIGTHADREAVSI